MSVPPALKAPCWKDFLMQRDIRADAVHDDLVQRSRHPRDRGTAMLAVRDDLRNQRIVVRRHHVAAIHVTVHPNARPTGWMPQRDGAGRWNEGLRILRVDAAFDRVSVPSNVLLRVAQRLAGRDGESAL